MRHNLKLPAHIERMLDHPQVGDRVGPYVLHEVRADCIIATAADGSPGYYAIGRKQWTGYVGTLVPTIRHDRIAGEA